MKTENLNFSVIFSTDEEKVYKLINLINDYFNQYSDGTNYTYVLYLYNFVVEIIKRVPQRPHIHFVSALSMHIKNIRKKANKARLNRQLENQTKLNSETTNFY